MAEAVSKIWTDADCCPYSVIQIIKIFEKDVWDVYYYWLREKRLPDSESIPSSSKRSNERNPSKPNKYSGEPRRISSHRDVASARTEIEETNMSNNNILPTNNLPTVNESSASNTTKSTRNQPSSAEQSKFSWH